MESKQKLIADNMNLVYFIISKEYPTFIRDEDIIQSGMLGLCKAAEKWDEEKSKFLNYAWTAIRNEINMELRNRSKHQGILSLDYMVNTPEGDSVPFGDIIQAQDDINMAEAEFDESVLTQREKEVYRMCKKGYGISEISEIIGVTKHTIWSIIRNIKRKRG